MGADSSNAGTFDISHGETATISGNLLNSGYLLEVDSILKISGSLTNSGFVGIGDDSGLFDVDSSTAKISGDVLNDGQAVCKHLS